jgi:DNA-binding transcriptional regulator YiaG
MAILGSALRAELVDAIGLASLRTDLRKELRAVMRELKGLRGLVSRLGATTPRVESTARRDSRTTISAAQIRDLRSRLGETRKAFAARLGVSPSIVFVWESGRSAPRRGAIVAKLQGLMGGVSKATVQAKEASGSNGRGTGARSKRKLTLSPQRRAALKLQGQYMGHLRVLKARQKAQVETLKAAKGFPAAIALAKRLAAA